MIHEIKLLNSILFKEEKGKIHMQFNITAYKTQQWHITNKR